MAQKLGYFDNEGVDVTILPTAQAGAETSVENGVADVGFTTLSNVAAFNAQGANLKMVFDLTQQPVARWCALASHTDISTPKDFDGKTFVSFGSAEQTAVLRQMIRTAGGTGDFKTATAGTNHVPGVDQRTRRFRRLLRHVGERGKRAARAGTALLRGLRLGRAGQPRTSSDSP